MFPYEMFCLSMVSGFMVLFSISAGTFTFGTPIWRVKLIFLYLGFHWRCWVLTFGKVGYMGSVSGTLCGQRVSPGSFWGSLCCSVGFSETVAGVKTEANLGPKETFWDDPRGE